MAMALRLSIPIAVAAAAVMALAASAAAVDATSATTASSLRHFPRMNPPLRCDESLTLDTRKRVRVFTSAYGLVLRAQFVQPTAISPVSLVLPFFFKDPPTATLSSFPPPPFLPI